MLPLEYKFCLQLWYYNWAGSADEPDNWSVLIGEDCVKPAFNRVSRISWIKEGDANSKLFHMHARHRQRKNFVAKIVSGVDTFTDHDEKARAVNEFYFKLLGCKANRSLTVDLEYLGLPSHDLSDLDAQIDENEVLESIMQLPSDKAPGPDGYTDRFYKVCWPIIKRDVMAVIAAIWCRKFRQFGRLNTAFVTLIPKKEGAEEVKDFRPISLVHNIAKLVTKLMANRLSQRLHDLVSLRQSAFIKGRFIQDNFMLVQQTARLLHQQVKPRVLLKLDLTKAFDSVSWPFLLEVLQHLGFGQIWRDIFSGLLATSSTQVLLNGVPGDIIHHKRGLRQGDPLSPMFFILVMDILGCIVAKADEEGQLQPLSSKPLHHMISLYADDAFLFFHPRENEIHTVLGILNLFGEASGLKTNIQKSSVYPIRCGQEELVTLHD
jgi:hypothetical protein